MSDVISNVISLADRKKNSAASSNPVEAKPIPPQRRRMLHLRAIFRKECKFGAIPDVIDHAYRSGKIDDDLFGLIYLILCSDEDFQITRKLLDTMWKCTDTLTKNLNAIKAARIVEIEEKRLRKAGKPANIYHVTDPKDWDIAPLMAASKDRWSNSPRKGYSKKPNSPEEGYSRKSKKANENTNSPQEGGYSKKRQSNSPQEGGYSKKRQSNSPLEGTLRKPLKTPAAKALNLDRLHSALTLRFKRITSSSHIKSLVNVLCDWEMSRLMMLVGMPENAAKVRARERVLALIKSVPACKEREFEDGTEDVWIKMLENFQEK